MVNKKKALFNNSYILYDTTRSNIRFMLVFNKLKRNDRLYK